MKKIAAFAVLSLAVAAVGCDSAKENATTDEVSFSQFYTQADADSLVSEMGYVIGLQNRREVTYNASRDTTFSIDDYIKGVQMAMSIEGNAAFTQGMAFGMQIRGQVENMQNNLDIPVDKGLMINRYKQAVLDEDINEETMIHSQQAFQKQIEKYERLHASYDSLKLASSEVSLANIERGKQYMAKLDSLDNVVVDASGIAYTIIEAGEGENIKSDDVVKINAVAKNLDGQPLRTYSPNVGLTLDRVEPGLAAGLAHLAQGGKATLYVPGHLAFGIGDRRNIAPNEFVVYDVEVVEVASK